mmetsp:Transcript_64216/g.172474  ORF Transcript_64216/g.172474 Transcript_64216/m.172474 type:complete len:322 (-) Transcript_64216:21-986(-)
MRLGIGLVEGGLAGRIVLAMPPEGFVRHEALVRREADNVRIFCPLKGLHHFPEVRVVELQPILCPRPATSSLRLLEVAYTSFRVGSAPKVALLDGIRPILESTANSVCPTKGDDVLVVHVVLVEDMTEVLCSGFQFIRGLGVGVERDVLCRYGRRQAEGNSNQLRGDPVHPAIPHVDLWAAHLLHGAGPAKLDQVRPRELRNLLFDGLQVAHEGLAQAGIRRSRDLVLGPDGAYGSSSVWPRPFRIVLVVGTSIVPSKAQQDWAAGLFFDHVLEQTLGRLERLALLGLIALTKHTAETIETRHGGCRATSGEATVNFEPSA